MRASWSLPGRRELVLSDILALVTLGVATGALVCVAGLVLRRTTMGRRERFLDDAERRLRPLAFALLDGNRDVPTPQSAAEAAIRAGMLVRYSRRLKGEVHENITAFFERSGFVQREIDALGSRRGWRRARAAYVLGDMGSPIAVQPLLRALEDRDRHVRAAAARALGQLRAPSAAEPLVFALVGRKVPRNVGGMALLSLGDPALARLRVLVNHNESAVRSLATELVGLLGSASDDRLLVGRLHDPAAEVRAKSARALGRLGSEECVAVLRSRLDDRIPFVRAAAAVALGSLDDRDAAPALEQQASNDRYEAARAAAEALSKVDVHALSCAASSPEAGPHIQEAAGLAELARR